MKLTYLELTAIEVTLREVAALGEGPGLPEGLADKFSNYHREVGVLYTEDGTCIDEEREWTLSEDGMLPAFMTQRCAEEQAIFEEAGHDRFLAVVSSNDQGYMLHAPHEFIG